jgi:hypothetical protein
MGIITGCQGVGVDLTLLVWNRVFVRGAFTSPAVMGMCLVDRHRCMGAMGGDDGGERTAKS